jgi:triacylglycerol lipase
MGRALETTLAVLNGAVGDYLARTHNGLATPMAVVQGDRAIPLSRPELVKAFADASPRVVVLVHGLMCTETVWDFADGQTYGSMLARDLGYTPLYVRYNSGLAIADSGAALARLLGTLVTEYPVPIEELVLLGFSMGGLVIRAACHHASAARSAWLALVRRAIYVGTPHLGAPYERFGRVVAKVLGAVNNPYTQLIAEIANLRSAGLQDLGDADLRHEDRASRSTVRLRDWRHPVPLLPAMDHYLVAGAVSREPVLAALFGDSVVPVRSAMHHDPDADEALPPGHVKLVSGVAHMGLAHDPDVYLHIRAWCDRAAPSHE